jgi:hypothetical protein
MKADRDFDELIKKAMKDLEARFEPGDWEMFKEQLESESLRSDVSLESIALNKLGNLEVPFEEGDWARMQQRIEAEETADLLEYEAALDNIIYEKISNFKVPYYHHHWQLMARRLEEEFSLRYQLYKYKAAEVALMVLLLVTIFRFMPYMDGFRQHHIINNPTHPYKNTPATTPSEQNQPSIASSSQEKPAVARSKDIFSEQQPDILHAKLINTNGLSGENYSQVEAEAKGGNDSQTGNRHQHPVSVRINERLPLLTIHQPTSWLDSEAARKFLSAENTIRQPLREHHSSLLAPLQPAPLESDYSWEVPQVKQQAMVKDGEIRFSVFSNTDVNYVFTPSNKLSVFDTLVATAPDTTAASGYGGGILVSWKKGKWELQSGGVYSFKRYIPNTPVFLFQTVNYYIKEDFHGVQLDILQVPLNVQYHFVDSGKWRFYGLGGLSGHFITSSVYQIKYRRILAFSASAFPVPSSPEDNRSIRQEKEFPKGLLDGGSLHDNFYLTANLGLGLERYLSTKWSVFLQPNYQHFLMSEGIGVNKDKFYTFSVYLGTKFSLK